MSGLDLSADGAFLHLFNRLRSVAADAEACACAPCRLIESDNTMLDRGASGSFLDLSGPCERVSDLVGSRGSFAGLYNSG
jgi:hypothetical protein